jgi:hypothetical protein
MCTRRLVATAAAFVVVAVAAPARAQSGPIGLRIACPPLNEEATALLEARARADIVSEPLPEGDVSIECDASRAIVSWQPKGEERWGRAVELSADGAVDSILRGLHEVLTEWEHARPPAPSVTPSAPREDDRHIPPVAAIVGVDGEAWAGHVAGAIGGHVGARVFLGTRWHASLLAGALRSVGDADGASAWGLRAIARVDYALVPRLDVGVGASGRVVWANAAGTTLSGTTAGATAAVRYGFPIGAMEVAVGGAVDALLRPIVIDVGAREAFRVPSVVVGLFVEVSYP